MGDQQDADGSDEHKQRDECARQLQDRTVALPSTPHLAIPTLDERTTGSPRRNRYGYDYACVGEILSLTAKGRQAIGFVPRMIH